MGYTKSKTKHSIRDSFETPRWLVGWLDSRFKFQIDLACSIDNKKFAVGYCVENTDSLKEAWHADHRVGFCNPPYSNIYPWLEKAIAERKKGFTSVFVLPSVKGDRWQKLALKADEIIFIDGRVSFINAETKRPVNGNNNGTIVCIYNPRSRRKTKYPKISSFSRDRLIAKFN